MTPELRQKLLGKFRNVGQERLAKLNNLWLELERHPDARDASLEAQREIHTLKGEARLLGLESVATLAHEIEDLMHQAGQAGYANRAQLDEVLRGFDLLATLVASDAAPQVDAAAPEAATATHRPNQAVPASGVLRIDADKLELLTRSSSELRAALAHRQTQVEAVGALVAQIDRVVGQRRHGREVSGDALEELRRNASQLWRTMREQQHDDKTRFERLGATIDGMRLVSLQTLFERYPRAVRDLAGSMQKEVRLELVDADVEVDRTVLDGLEEPLLHLLRNAVDHGCEMPDERLSQDKEAAMHLRLSARLDGASVEIVVEDDGRGVDLEELRSAAVSRRVLSYEAAQGASESELMALLFMSGFSTRRELSEISGRGIGLDVVKQSIERMGGSVDMVSRKNMGTCFTLRVPPSIATWRALIVEAGGGRYAVPAAEVASILLVEPNDIEHAGEGELLRRDGAPVPLVDLGTLLGVSTPVPLAARPVIILEHAGRQHGFFVSRVAGQGLVVHKPAGPLLAGARLVRGAAVLESGEVAVSLDTVNLIELGRRAVRHRAVPKLATSSDRRAKILVVEDSEVMRDMLCAALREVGHEVTEAVNGRAALTSLETNLPDLIVTDLQMPVLDGFEMLRALRRDTRFRSLPVVVCSTLGSEADKRQAAALGADAYVVKSNLDKQTLIQAVQRFVRAGGGVA